MPSFTRRSAFFRFFRCLLSGCRDQANAVKVPWGQGLGAVPTTLRLYPKHFAPIRKTLYAYTQNEKGTPKLVQDRCRMVAPFFRLSCTRIILILSTLQAKVARVAPFFLFSVDVGELFKEKPACAIIQPIAWGII